jgi:hypothetical protein
MIILTLIGISLLIAICLFLFGWLWYSKPIFGRFFEKEMSGEGHNLKLALSMEFLACLLLALASVMVFAPFDWYFGLINGLVIGIAILLPFAISDAVWHAKSSLAIFFIKFGHKLCMIVISFMLAGILNSLIIPMVIGANGVM